MQLSMVKSAAQWCAQCEQYFLGRAREHARTAVEDAVVDQSPQRISKFEEQGLSFLGLYTPPLSEIVLSVKMQRWSRARNALGELLAQKVSLAMFNQASASMHFVDTNTSQHHSWIVVPIPTPFLRRVMRGIDHTHIIASAMARELHIPLRQVLWQRFSATQKTLSRTGRLQREQRFALRRSYQSSLVGKSVILVDDIRTTGATLREATQVLKAAGVQRVQSAVACLVEGKA